MKRQTFILSCFLLGFAIFCGIMASRDYRDPVGVAFLILFGFAAGLGLGASLTGEKETITKETQDAKHQEH